MGDQPMSRRAGRHGLAAHATGLTRMARFLLSRLVQFPLILAVIYLITFFMAWGVPGDPFQKNERNLPKARLEARRREFHAEKWRSFLVYYSGRVLRHGDFGQSMQY